jgi:hypothetical protein
MVVPRYHDKETISKKSSNPTIAEIKQPANIPQKSALHSWWESPLPASTNAKAKNKISLLAPVIEYKKLLDSALKKLRR